MFAEADRPGIREREKEELAALKRKYAHTTDSAKRAELANRLARMGHDPNEDSLLGNPVPDRKSPPKATVADIPDMDPNKAAAEARGVSPENMDAWGGKSPGDQEMYNHETGKWSVTPIGEQAMRDFGDKPDEAKSETGQGVVDAEPVKDEAKPKAEFKPAAKPLPKTTDPKNREAK